MMKAAVIGNPIDHSKSPRLHNHWLNILGIRGQYQRIYAELDKFEPTIRNMVNEGFRGTNVTLPFKGEARMIANTVSKFVEQNGAANTLIFDGQKIDAHNTDGYGFGHNILDHYPDWDPKGDHIILGAGGAANAIVAWLVNQGARSISIVNRNQERAENLRKMGSQISIYAWNDIPQILAKKSTIINTTSLGMKGVDDLQIDWSNASREMIVNDIVYTPLETGFLKSAKSAGLRTVDGLGMLLWQARPGFRAWFGQEPPKIDHGLRNFMLSKHIFALTGSIGMGKSTVAEIFADFGFQIWDADKEVAVLYDNNDELYSYVKQKNPDATRDGKIEKSIWRNFVFANPEIFPDLEKLIHSTISQSRRVFLESEAPLKLCDIPLLFETGGEYLYDKTIAVTASQESQRTRVLARGKMNEAQMDEIIKKQMPDSEKCGRADAVIDNEGSIDNTRAQVQRLLENWGVLHA